MQPDRSCDMAAALPALTEELVEEILLRIPPDEPSLLIHAALVCKDWRRILSDGGFRRRYCRFHRSPPLLGYINNQYFRTAFVPTTSFSPTQLPAGIYSYLAALDCRHGRVLIRATKSCSPSAGLLIVWDPITGDQQHLSLPAHPHLNNSNQLLCSFTGAVLCAVDGCDHLDCHGGPFLVVFVGTPPHPADGAAGVVTHARAAVYSSETGAWSDDRTSSSDDSYHYVKATKPLLLGDALYFTLVSSNGVIRILKYDLGGHGLSVVDTPPQVCRKVVPTDVDGGLGLVEFTYKNFIYMWSRSSLQADDADGGIERWVRHNVGHLETLIPWPPHHRSVYRHHRYDSIHFAEGTDFIFLSFDNYIDTGVFTLNLKSRQLTRVAERPGCGILPYMSFYTPGLITCAFL